MSEFPNTKLYSVLDPMEAIGKYYNRVPYDYLFDVGTDFTTDIEIPIDVCSGYLHDISVGVDSTDWSLVIVAKPGLIAGNTPTGDEMIEWTNDIVLVTGAITSNWYTYQNEQMSPKFFSHIGMAYSTNSLYARFMVNDSITRCKMRLLISRVS